MNRYVAMTAVLFGLWPSIAFGQGRPENARRPSVPIANAGPDVTVRPGRAVMLHASGSSESSGRPLQFEWSLIEAPSESRTELKRSHADNLTFVPDVGGVFVLRLTVRSGNLSATDDVRVIANRRPTAAAGRPRTAARGTIVRLDGSGSSDPEGDLLAFSWRVRDPHNLAVAVEAPTTPTPTFAVSVAGKYTATLIVRDALGRSRAADVEIDTRNAAPLANAGPVQRITSGQRVVLDATGSTDPDGDRLQFRWTMVSRPAGSRAVLDRGSAPRPSFVADKSGSYQVALAVSDGRYVDNQVVVATTGNVAPVADAGPDTRVGVGQAVNLSGSGSTDANGDRLTYAWSLIARPAGSAATVSSGRPDAGFVADIAGVYVAQLTATDSAGTSDVDTVLLSTAMLPPRAIASGPALVRPGQPALLDGAGSLSTFGDSLQYQWALVSAPTGSAAMLAGTTSNAATFTPDVAGSYVAQLVVTDSAGSSTPYALALSTGTVAPVAVVAAPAPAARGVPVHLDAIESFDPDGDEVTFSWSLLHAPAGSTAVLSAASTGTASIVTDAIGLYVAQVVVNDGVFSTSTTVPIVSGGRISVSPLQLSFGQVQAGTSGRTMVVSVSNLGGEAVEVLGVSWFGNPFAVSNDCLTQALAPGQTCEVEVTFLPPAAGAASGRVEIGTSAGDSLVTLDGTAVLPSLKVSPSALNFGSIQVGQSSTSQAIQLENDGIGPVHVVGLRRDPGLPVAVEAGTCTAILAPGTTCQLRVVVTPTTAGPINGSLRVVSDSWPGETEHVVATVDLTATVVSPSLKVSPLSLDLGPLPIGRASAPHFIQLENDGIGPVHVVGVRRDPGLPVAVEAGTCTAILAPGTTCQLAVVVTPTTAGPINGSLRVVSDSWPGETEHVVATVGLTATAVSPSLKVSPLLLDFGTMQLGETRELRVHFENDGIVPVHFEPFERSPDFPIAVQAGTCTSILPPGSTCELPVLFTPTAAGPIAGWLQVFSDSWGAADPHHLVATITISGVALSPTLVAGPLALDFGTVGLGDAIFREVTITNPGLSPINFVLGASPDQFSPSGGSCLAGRLAAGATCVLQVQFSPFAAGPAVGTIHILSDASSPGVFVSLASIAVGGTGAAPSFTATPTSVNFDGTTRQTVTITNTSAVAIKVEITAQPGNFSAAFEEVGSFPMSWTVIDAGASKTLSIDFLTYQLPGGKYAGSFQLRGTGWFSIPNSSAPSVTQSVVAVGVVR
jgi:hypothetical protein